MVPEAFAVENTGRTFTIVFATEGSAAIDTFELVYDTNNRASPNT